MSDQTTPASGDAQAGAVGAVQTPDAPENKGADQSTTPQTPEAKSNIEVPKDKWDQMYARTKTAEDKLKEYQEAEKKREEEKALEDGKFQDVIDSLKTEKSELLTKAESLDKMNGTLQKYLDVELNKVDESKRSLIPDDFTTQQKLDYIIANQSFLYSEQAKINNSTPALPKTDDEMALNELEKAKNELAELKAKRESTGHLNAVEASKVSKLVRMIAAAST
jgi:hypothetical protein